MAATERQIEGYPESQRLGAGAASLTRMTAVIGIVGLAAGLALGFIEDKASLRRFFFVYLVSYTFFLSLALGGLFFVLLQHVTRAGWSVSVRRIAEALAATMPVLAVLAIPILASVLMNNGSLYRWAQPQVDHLTHEKHAYLNVPFFVARLAIYLVAWSAMGWWYWRQSTQQDATGDPALTSRMQTVSAPALVVYALTVTLGAFDLLMSLDPHWFSTIFGVYYFSGAAVGAFATVSLVAVVLQSRGFLRESITREHYHDLGKFLFGFVFFWGYIAFSQYMLIWYANIPEETAWLVRHGMSTAHPNGWSVVCLLLLFGHLLVPFAGLLSRGVKRNKKLLAFWAAWLLAFHGLDLFWLVMPESVRLSWLSCAMGASTLIGVGGLFLAAFVRLLGSAYLRPIRDPRLDEALEFQNI